MDHTRLDGMLLASTQPKRLGAWYAAVLAPEEQGTTRVAPLEDRDGSLFATGTDRDGNYVQVIQLSDEHRVAMS